MSEKYKYTLSDKCNTLETGTAESATEFAKLHNLEFVYSFVNCATVRMKDKPDWVFGLVWEKELT